MKKIIAMALTAALSLSALGGLTAIADDEPIKILINGEELVIPEDDTQPFIDNERTLVPMRAIFEALGAKVTWDGDTETVVSYDPVSDVSIVLQINSVNMFVGDKKVEIDVPAKIVNDRTVVPVRAIAEGMNSKVDWDGDTRTVIVEKDLGSGTSGEEATTPAQMPNPWVDYATLEELNAAIVENGDVKYTVADPKTPATVKENGYRYLASENLAEIQARWEVGSSADIIIRTAPGEKDISGIFGGNKVEDFNLADGTTASLYEFENTVYAVWTSVKNDVQLSHCVAVTADDWDTTEVTKQLADEVESND